MSSKLDSFVAQELRLDPGRWRKIPTIKAVAAAGAFAATSARGADTPLSPENVASPEPAAAGRRQPSS